MDRVNTNTPDALKERADRLQAAASAIGDVIIADRRLDETDRLLPNIRLTLRLAEQWFENREETLRRRRDGMLAQ